MPENQENQGREEEQTAQDLVHAPMGRKKRPLWSKLLFSDTLCGKSVAVKCAYIAVCVAMLAAANTVLEFKMADTQFSFTTFFCILAGVLIGPVFGFVAAFLGDLIGFVANSGGFLYYPWVGIAMGLAAMIGGIVFGVLPLPWKGTLSLFVKAAIASVLTFVICSVAINTTAYYLLYSGGRVDYWAYFLSRYIVKGQLWVSLINYALLFVTLPILVKIKPLKIKIA